MKETLGATAFNFPGQKSYYQGKVREVYDIDDRYLVMIASDRISAFDHILPERIPYKGQVLNQIAGKFLKATEDIVPNWVLRIPDPNVTIGIKCEPIMVEMVIRGYLAGHAWREYKAGKRMLCGMPMPEGMKENDRFPEPIITPATKATDGHDEDISREEILAQGIVSEADYVKMEDYTRRLYQRGTEMAASMGLILVDTKYEFGKVGDEIYLMDEIHTPDSSRYFYADTYQQLQDAGVKQKQLSKEFIREWLMSKGFQGLEGQEMPDMDNKIVDAVSQRYIELYEKLTGESLHKPEGGNVYERVEQNVLKSLSELAG